MDDLTDLEWTRHAGWSAYRAVPQHGRLLRLTTAGNTAYTGVPG